MAYNVDNIGCEAILSGRIAFIDSFAKAHEAKAIRVEVKVEDDVWRYLIKWDISIQPFVETISVF